MLYGGMASGVSKTSSASLISISSHHDVALSAHLHALTNIACCHKIANGIAAASMSFFCTRIISQANNTGVRQTSPYQPYLRTHRYAPNNITVGVSAA